MDAHLVIKIMHLVAMSLLIIAFVMRAATLYIGVEHQQPNPHGRKALVGLQHLALTLVVISGLTLLWMNQFQVQPWFYAKIILFLVLWSSLIKTYKKDDSIQLVQRRAGLVISMVALVGIIGLVMIKPVFA